MSPRSRKRPRVVTWLAVLVLIVGVANLLGAYGLASRWRVLTSLEMTLPPWGLLIPALVWGVGWLVLAWGLWRLRPWAWWGTLIAFPLYELMLIGRQVFFVRAAYARGRLPFAAGLAVAVTALVIFVLTRRGVRQAFESRQSTAEETDTT
ncbi:MAG TPA: hypothetical protein PK801_08195 [Aggregatilineales bacterium]|nr:hypothetical protein [Chloroflexota bacterium]HOA23478.1 hypothetical protein [Aggregatilineales bacterium]HPV06264.1 hypothetical protein [Aggregatilineales bacterium]HQA68290.1 hypothetical protein [Aggregatilineales bacterium]HQE18148.1 hypothetical protein [Aggregatilineales bacterium]